MVICDLLNGIGTFPVLIPVFRETGTFTMSCLIIFESKICCTNLKNDEKNFAIKIIMKKICNYPTKNKRIAHLILFASNAM